MHPHLPSPVTFREDINGLRAWAVMVVLLFHFSLFGLSGGFAGVDVFFVISGYLMTAIVVGGHLKGRFSIWKFYQARIRRILPALMVMIAVLLLLGWFWLPTIDYQALGAQSAFGMTFSSNIHFYRGAGYFDSAAEEKWLLHTWSLAVEAQFYLIYPLIIALIWRVKPHIQAVTWGVVALFSLSFGLNLYLTQTDPSAAFYLLPTRAWELAAGGLVYLATQQNWGSESIRRNLYWFGWLLMVSSFVLIDKFMAWPGYWAVLPVLGTSLIIWGQKQDCFFTNNGLAQWLGDRSYSLYLWHWPIVVALYFASLHTEWLWVLGGFALSLVLAHLSFHWIETPTRQYLSRSSLHKEVLVIGLAGILLGGMAVMVKMITFDQRVPVAVEAAANASTDTYPRIAECFIEDAQSQMPPGCIESVNSASDQVGVIKIGDSHSYSTLTALAVAAQPVGVKYWAISACPTMFDVVDNNPAKRDKCATFNRWVQQEIAKLPNSLPLVIVNRTNWYLWGDPEALEKTNRPKIHFTRFVESSLDEVFQQEYSDHLVEAACAYQAERPTYLMRPLPEIGVDVPDAVSRNMMFGRNEADIKIPLAQYQARNQVVWQAQDRAAEQCGVKILNPLPYLCDDEYCYGSKDGVPLYTDTNHLSEKGNKLLVPMFESIFQK